MKIMKSKYSGKCGTCGERIAKGSEIGYDGATRTAHHASCVGRCDPAQDFIEEQENDSHFEDAENGIFPPSRTTLENDRRMAKRGLTVVRFSSGAVYTQNSRGRCEDAPCCGCCN